MTTQQPAPPDRPMREMLAAQFLSIARVTRGHCAFVAKDSLHLYVFQAEDTIKLQSQMLRDDQSENLALRAEIGQLKIRIATLQDLIEEAIAAGQHGDGEAISIIRTAIEGSA